MLVEQRNPIKDPSRLLEVPFEDKTSKEANEVKGMEYVICAIDIGSTNPKVEAWIYDPKTKTLSKKEVEIEWGDYRPHKREVCDTNLKFLDPEQVAKLLTLIEDQVKEALVEEKFNDSRQLVFAITGFHHDLCITNEKTGETAIILDDPSPHPMLEPSQVELLSEQFRRIGKSLDSFINHPTSLEKILWLLQNPHALKDLFGTRRGVSFDQLSFSVIRSLIAKNVLGGRNENLLPPGERNDFGVHKMDGFPHIAAFLEKIGVSAHQILFSQSQLMAGNSEEYGDVMLFDENDLPAELTVISWAMRQGKINRLGTVVCADSVGKIIFDTETCPATRSHNEASGTAYDTQRMLGNVNREWLGPLVLEEGEHMSGKIYKKIDKILRDLVEKKTETPYIYIPTEKGTGMLFKFDGDRYNEIRKSEAKNWPKEEKELAMLAIARGIAFGIRQKMDFIRSKNEAGDAPVYFYGGVLGHPQEPGGKDGWQKIFVGAMPEETPVYEIDLPSGATAVAFCALQKLLSSEDNNEWQKKFSEVEIKAMGVGGDLKPQYENWIRAQEAMIRQELLEIEGDAKIVKRI